MDIHVEFRKGDIEKGVPVKDSDADVVISNCVINLTVDKVAAFKEIHKILRSNGRMVISDLVTENEGFHNPQILEEKLYQEGDGIDSKKITSLVIKAVK